MAPKQKKTEIANALTSLTDLESKQLYADAPAQQSNGKLICWQWNTPRGWNNSKCKNDHSHFSAQAISWQLDVALVSMGGRSDCQPELRSWETIVANGRNQNAERHDQMKTVGVANTIRFNCPPGGLMLGISNFAQRVSSELVTPSCKGNGPRRIWITDAATGLIAR